METGQESIRTRYGSGDSYLTPKRRPAAKYATARFLGSIALGPLAWLWWQAIHNRCNDSTWSAGSDMVADLFENIGGQIQISGLDNLRALQGPCVFIGNHMSTLETFLLPGIIRPIMPVTFVVKKSLTTMPVFGPVMRSRNPVVVERKNPRDDLVTVLKEGVRRLADGISIIVFPQHTRSLYFDQEQFNSIGVKLAQKAGVPVVPIALKTDAWGQGRRIKELGRIQVELPAHFLFGKPLTIEGKGREEHLAICQFLQRQISHWQQMEGINLG